MKKKGSVVQLDRISDFGSEGWGFESSLGNIFKLNLQWLFSLNLLVNLFVSFVKITYSLVNMFFNSQIIS